MFLECAELQPIGTNAYFVANEDLKQAFVVDAPLGAFASLTDAATAGGVREASGLSPASPD